MNTRLIRTLALLAAILLPALSGPGPVSAGEPAPLKIGLVYDMSGPGALSAKEGRQAAQLAIDLTNAKGGVAGRKIEVVFRDMGGALSLDRTVNQLLNEENVQALVGLDASETALVAGPAAQAQGVPLLAAACTLTGLSAQVGNNFFSAAFANPAQARTMAEFAVNSLGYPKVVILHCPATDAGADLYEQLKTALPKAGGELLFYAEVDDQGEELPVDMDELSHYSHVMEAILLIAPPDLAVKTVAALRAAGFDQAVVASVDMDFPGVEKALGENCGQVFFVSMADLGGPLPETRLFAKRYAEKYGAPPQSGFAAAGFDAAALLVNALSRAKTQDRNGIRAALATIRSFSGVSGAFAYKPGDRTPEKTVYVMGVENGARSLAGAFKPE